MDPVNVAALEEFEERLSDARSAVMVAASGALDSLEKFTELQRAVGAFSDLMEEVSHYGSRLEDLADQAMFEQRAAESTAWLADYLAGVYDVREVA